MTRYKFRHEDVFLNDKCDTDYWNVMFDYFDEPCKYLTVSILFDSVY